MKAWALLLIFALFLFLVLAPGRKALGWFLSKPGMKVIGYWIFAIKFLWHAHYTVIRNLLLPHRVIYPTLESDETVKRG